ncbi:hypothetical protein QR680_004480 [Steinernema hermaphroditum]|uniref:Uncharacterized protein n=1 Tax=Steinernema hermaphroditum TaxID=289476 RepID=A0AA39HPY1_9BILA|nr:hypothetical protein QR680_004480 [Steinernema hermaphroditum]
MDTVPTEFIADVIAASKTTVPFQELSGRWCDEALRETNRIGTGLIFKRCGPDIVFGSRKNCLLDAILAGDPSDYFVNERKYHILDESTSRLLTHHFKKNTHRVQVFLANSANFDQQTIRPILFSIPRIAYLVGDVRRTGASFSHDLLKEAVRRGTLEYCREYSWNGDYLSTFKEYIASRNIALLGFFLKTDEKEGDELIRRIAGKWIEKQNCEAFELKVPSELFGTLKKCLSKQGFKLTLLKRGGGGKWISLRRLLFNDVSVWKASKKSGDGKGKTELVIRSDTRPEVVFSCGERLSAVSSPYDFRPFCSH